MAIYYVNINKQDNVDHEVHIIGCTFMHYHCNKTFREEYIELLDKFDVPYEDRFFFE